MVAWDSNPEPVGWSRSFFYCNIKKKIPPQTVLVFFVAHGFPYVYI
ncbi:photosystem II protein D1 [Iris pallida]|uniref:Photosystem II protein D1 (Plastid) n=1 Tax=Iris pallida TaxID=29817 RepID=A0AAX6HGS2_IRIPA|nr:photosystem II protein D1 [Iris pallida]